jgi:phytoene dehydrogenase-like protein
MAMDAVVVGAGPNGLAAAVVLARAGLGVRVYEAADRIGGGTKTAELTLPGFRHDVCSAVHPLGVNSPFFASLPLERLGVEWVQPTLPMAHPLPRGEVAVLDRSAETTAAGLGQDRTAYLALVSPFEGRWDDVAADVLRPIGDHLPADPVVAARFGARAILPLSVVARRFKTEAARTMLAGLAAHAVAPLNAVATGGVALLFTLTAHAGGWPFPRGGSQAIADALAAQLVELGGEVVTGTAIERLDELPPARACLLDVSVPALLRLAGDRLPAGYVARLRRYRSGPAVFKVDYALSGPVPWTAKAARQAGTVHVGSFVEIRDALASVTVGRLPERPFLITSQPTVFDPSRAPSGQHTLWVYGHVPFAWDGDLTEAIEAQIERYAPGFRDLVLARAPAGPAIIEARNANNIGGDIACGAFGGRQALFRPVVSRHPYATPDPTIYLCSSATPPGPGVHGMCGYHAARAALRRQWGIRIPATPHP